MTSDLLAALDPKVALFVVCMITLPLLGFIAWVGLFVSELAIASKSSVKSSVKKNY